MMIYKVFLTKSANLKLLAWCVLRNFESINEDNVEECLRSDVCELGFQHMTDKGTANAATKQKGEEEEGGEDESEEEGQSSKCIRNSMALQCVDTTRLHGSEGVRIQ
jgi:hypothetical protein